MTTSTTLASMTLTQVIEAVAPLKTCGAVKVALALFEDPANLEASNKDLAQRLGITGPEQVRQARKKLREVGLIVEAFTPEIVQLRARVAQLEAQLHQHQTHPTTPPLDDTRARACDSPVLDTYSKNKVSQENPTSARSHVVESMDKDSGSSNSEPPRDLPTNHDSDKLQEQPITGGDLSPPPSDLTADDSPNIERACADVRAWPEARAKDKARDKNKKTKPTEPSVSWPGPQKAMRGSSTAQEADPGPPPCEGREAVATESKGSDGPRPTQKRKNDPDGPRVKMAKGAGPKQQGPGHETKKAKSRKEDGQDKSKVKLHEGWKQKGRVQQAQNNLAHWWDKLATEEPFALRANDKPKWWIVARTLRSAGLPPEFATIALTALLWQSRPRSIELGTKRSGGGLYQQCLKRMIQDHDLETLLGWAGDLPDGIRRRDLMEVWGGTPYQDALDMAGLLQEQDQVADICNSSQTGLDDDEGDTLLQEEDGDVLGVSATSPTSDEIEHGRVVAQRVRNALGLSGASMAIAIEQACERGDQEGLERAIQLAGELLAMGPNDSRERRYTRVRAGPRG